MTRPDNPLIVQGDRTVLVEVDSPRFAEVRPLLARFADLEKMPEHVHTYRLGALSLWNARASGMATAEILAVLEEYAKFPLPAVIPGWVRETAGRFGRLELRRAPGGGLLLVAADAGLADELAALPPLAGLLTRRLSSTAFHVELEHRGRLKVRLVEAGHPAEDLAGYTPGEPLAIALRDTCAGSGRPFVLRDYQRAAVEAFHCGGGERGGSGVLTLPCGAGKTIVAIAAMAAVGASTLVLVTGVTAARQWIAELRDKTGLAADQVGEYDGTTKTVAPVTVATYQVLTHRDRAAGGMPHLELFDRRDWGLVVYDEVHLLPAPVFQATAGIQARRRLGLTATLVREDGHERDVFALIGPRKADVAWKALEAEGWIARAVCSEVRLAQPAELRIPYLSAPAKEKHRLAAENPAKLAAVRDLMARHPGAPTLIIGLYVEQVVAIADALGIPHLIGSTAQRERERLYAGFRAGTLSALAVSKVANSSVDLPDASVAIQVSGTFGSRQEEAQRLGRILRPKPGENRAWFYSLVTADTVEQEFALQRQRFLCEQGYEYRIEDWRETCSPA
jgi:DNA excision repair protein ERCC-3